MGNCLILQQQAARAINREPIVACYPRKDEERRKFAERSRENDECDGGSNDGKKFVGTDVDNYGRSERFCALSEPIFKIGGGVEVSQKPTAFTSKRVFNTKECLCVIEEVSENVRKRASKREARLTIHNTYLSVRIHNTYLGA